MNVNDRFAAVASISLCFGESPLETCHRVWAERESWGETWQGWRMECAEGRFDYRLPTIMWQESRGERKLIQRLVYNTQETAAAAAGHRNSHLCNPRYAQRLTCHDSVLFTYVVHPIRICEYSYGRQWVIDAPLIRAWASNILLREDDDDIL